MSTQDPTQGSEQDPAQGLIFDIQGFSVHDGPGARTLVFMCGCPLRCTWCANPEGMKNVQNLMFTSSRCKAHQNHCNRCVSACPSGAIQMEGTGALPQIRIERAHCPDCSDHECVAACNYEALRLSGKYYTIPELMRVIQRDRSYWGTEGGVTFGGGDPVIQWQFVLAALQACKQSQIHTAIETSAHTKEEIFLRLLDYLDFAFVDVKHMDDKKHRLYTGVGNQRIHDNLRALAKSDWPGRIILRMPVIPGFNDDEANALATIRFMKANGFFEINLLPFHRMGSSKWEQLGKEYLYKDQGAMHKEDLIPLQELYFEHRIACYLDSDVPYNLQPLPTSPDLSSKGVG